MPEAEEIKKRAATLPHIAVPAGATRPRWVIHSQGGVTVLAIVVMLSEGTTTQATLVECHITTDHRVGVVGITPSPFYQEKLCNLFGMTAEALELSNSANTKSEQVLVTTERIPLDQSINDRLDPIESTINFAWEAWFASIPKQAAQAVTKLLPDLEGMIYTPFFSAYKLRLSELVIRSHGLLGAICLDALQNESALFHYMKAHKLAEEIHHTNSEVIYLTLIGDVLRRQNKKNDAISHMENARDKSSRTTQNTHGFILQLLAYTYADTGNEKAFERTIQEATNLLAFTGEGRDVARKEFNPFEIYEIRGKANRDLGKPLEAIAFLDAAEKSLEKVESVTPRFHALLDISRGQAYCDAGDIQTGIDLASRGFILAHRCRSPRQMNRVRKLLKKLESSDSPWRGERKVAGLKDLVRETYAEMDVDK